MKIGPHLHDDILIRVAKGATLDSIAAWLKGSHAISISRSALSRLVKRHRRERATVAKHIVRSHIEEHLPGDLETLEKIMATNVRLLRRAQRAALRELTTANVEKVEKLTRLVLKADEANKRALGLDQPETSPFQGLAELVGLDLNKENSKQ